MLAEVVKDIFVVFHLIHIQLRPSSHKLRSFGTVIAVVADRVAVAVVMDREGECEEKCQKGEGQESFVHDILNIMN